VNCGKAVALLLLQGRGGGGGVGPSRQGLPPQGRTACVARVSIRQSNCRSAPRAACGGAGAAPPQNHHPDQPAAHTAFQTHWARLVSNMGHRSTRLRVLGAHFHHVQGHIFPRRGSARDPAVASQHPYWTHLMANGFWPLIRAVRRAYMRYTIYAKQCVTPHCTHTHTHPPCN
jgi:hypothetical protein